MSRGHANKKFVRQIYFIVNLSSFFSSRILCKYKVDKSNNDKHLLLNIKDYKLWLKYYFLRSILKFFFF